MAEKLPDEEVGKRLRAARALRDMDDQDEVAIAIRDALKVPRTAYGEYERGARTLRGRDRLAMADFFRLPLRWFTEPEDALLGERPEPSLAARLASIDQQLEGIVAELTGLRLQRQPPEDPSNQSDTDATENPEEDDPPQAGEQP